MMPNDLPPWQIVYDHFNKWNKLGVWERIVDRLNQIVRLKANWVILSGYVSGDIFRGLLVGVVVALISMLFADIVVLHVGVTITVAILTATLFSLAGFINAMLAESFDDISIIPNFVLTPLSYLGGVFYSVDMLSGFWQTVIMGNPILYMINAFRYGMIGVTDVDIQWALMMIVGFIVVLALFSLFLLHKGIGIKN